MEAVKKHCDKIFATHLGVESHSLYELDLMRSALRWCLEMNMRALPKNAWGIAMEISSSHKRAWCDSLNFLIMACAHHAIRGTTAKANCGLLRWRCSATARCRME